MRIRSLLPSDRAQLIDILSQGAGFRSAEVACAIELLDGALAPADPDEEPEGYEARVAVEDDAPEQRARVRLLRRDADDRGDLRPVLAGGGRGRARARHRRAGC